VSLPSLSILVFVYPLNHAPSLSLLASLIWSAITSVSGKRAYAVQAFLFPPNRATNIRDWHGGGLKYSRKYSKANQQQKVVQDLSATAFVGFLAWFWWFGLDQFKPTPCGMYGYHDELDLYGPPWIFIKVCSVLIHGLGVKIVSKFGLHRLQDSGVEKWYRFV
jgi:hypothetical protein